ncbi:MAG TPA: CRISPR system precrRNA processing endoribonuclease RAMP protein Cas6 [Geobacteraceae bacterium]
MDLNLIRLIVTLRLEADIADRYALFGMRPYFEEAFRQAAACGGSAGPCTRGADCPYHQTFSQQLSADPAALRRYQKPSLPFVFHIPPIPEPPNRGNTLELELILAGSAANFVSCYIAALAEMLMLPGLRRRVPAILTKVESEGYDGCRTLVMAPGKDPATDRLTTLSLRGLLDGSVLAPDRVTIAFVTPLLILHEGKPLREFSFSPFMRALFRRVSAMAYYYGGAETALDYKWLAGQSLAVECIGADFRWVEWGRKWYGVIGRGTFRGDLADFHPFLLAGELLHAGKGAAFGQGRFILERNA